MSQKEYLSVDYICQELRRSVNDYLSGKAGGVIGSSYTFHSVINEGEIRYSIAGLEAVLYIKRHGKGENYNLHEIVISFSIVEEDLVTLNIFSIMQIMSYVY